MENSNLVQKLEMDLQSARGNHSSQIAIINGWRDESNGESYTEASRGGEYGAVVNKLIKKTIETATPSLVEPFLGNHIVGAQGRDAESDHKAEVASSVLNYFWNYGINPEEFIEPLVRNLQTDGTVICKVGWSEDHPTVEEIPLDSLLLDPSAKRFSDCNFAIEQSKVSVSDILGHSGWYGEHTIESLAPLTAASSEEYDVNKDGYDSSFNFEDRLRQLVSINTYYGKMEIDGELKSIVAIWSDNFLINMMDSPYPKSWKGLPFIMTDYIPVSGSIYGKSIASLLSIDQRIATSLDRSIMKQLDHSTIGQRGISQGALDPANERKFKAGKDFKFNNKTMDIWEGSFTQLSPDVYALQDKTRVDAEELSGISRLSAGLDPRALNSNVSATASSLVNSNAQRRLLLVMRHVSSLLEQMFRKWLDITVLMADDLSVRLNNEIMSIQGFDLEGNFDINIDISTDGQRSEKAQQLSMVLQQLGSNPAIPKSVTMTLTSEFVTALGMYELGDTLKGLSKQMQQSEGQPNPMQEAQVKMEMEARQAQITKDNAQAKKYEADAVESYVDTELKSYGMA